MKPENHTSDQEGGFVLILVLGLLAMLSILAISAMDSGILEQKMAGNTQFQSIAINDAEGSLVQGEEYIRNSITGTYATFAATPPVTITSKKFILPGNNNVSITHLVSKVIVEVTEPYTGAAPGCGAGQTGCLDYYRVTTISQTTGGAAQSVESIFAKYTPY
jgi:hypothetical protein